jgi:hypothetical protein
VRLALRKSTLVLVATLLGLSVIGTSTSAEAKSSDDIRFTKGPGNGSPPPTLHGIPVTTFAADTRATGVEVSDIGPLALSKPAVHLHVDETWESWSNAYHGDVYLTSGVTITLPPRTSAFSFYAQPDRYRKVTIKAKTDDGTNAKVSVDGTDEDGDAKYFGFYSTKPLTSFIKTVKISSSEPFAFGELGIGYGFSPYAALGDSYSSGEGVGQYATGTDTVTDRCHRSAAAYPERIAAADRDRRPLTFVACSGATTYDLSNPNHLFAGEPAQEDALSPLNRKVSLTVGGNDLGFADVLGACLAAPGHDGRGCSEDPRLGTLVSARLAALAGQSPGTASGGTPIIPVATVLSDLHARAPKARIFVGAYPELFGDDAADFTADPSAPSGASCVVDAALGASLDRADTQWINERTRALNGVLKAAVKAAEKSDRSLEATFVQARTFDGHGLCDDHKAWINPLILLPGVPPTVSPESFHPTEKGQLDGYAKAFRSAGL